jgi:hypothetical protein
MAGNLKTHLLCALLIFIGAAIGASVAPARAADGADLMGPWRVPPYKQEAGRMTPQCEKHASGEVDNVAESEVQVFACDDPKYAQTKQRILDYVRSVNPIYRAQGHPLYSETISGMCAVVTASQSDRQQDLCSPAEKLRTAPILGLPVIWNIRKSNNAEWPLMGDSYSPSSGYGAISCFRRPGADKVITKGCRRWTVELPFIGAEPCDCGCSMIVCDQFTWQRK